MLGILCEKPSAARNFAKALGGMNGTYQGTPYKIVAAAGHLYEFVMPAEQVPTNYAAQYKSWALANLPWDETLFSWKRTKSKNATKLLSNIKSELSTCSEIAIATDVDPSGEGQLIAWEILSELHLMGGKTISRFIFMDESVASIQKAFVTRQTLPAMHMDPEYQKSVFRAQWDMLSMQFTRIASVCTPNQVVLRQGRLKSAMVQIVGDGLMAVRNYKRVPFYMNKFRDENGVIYTNPEEPRYEKQEDVPQVYYASKVICDNVSQKTTAPPKLLDLAGLSSRLASKGFKAKHILSVYQKMYEANIVSYPRTEDKTITPEQFKDLLPYVDKIANLVGVDVSLLTHRTPRNTHVKTGGAHGANRPGTNVPTSLANLDVTYGSGASDIYVMLAKNYLAMLAEDYVYESQKGHIEDYPKFVGTASVPKFMGWKVVFNPDDDVVDDTENAKGLGSIGQPFVAEGANPKPPTPTMKWLMKQLEKNDVGTGATRTSTYGDIVDSTKNKYPLLSEKQGKLDITEYGEMSYTLLKDTKIGDVSLTEQLQKQMRGIADGTLHADACLHEVQSIVRHDLEIMQENAKKLKGAGTMATTQQKEKYSGTWNGTQVSFTRTWGGHRFSDAECEALCRGEEIEVLGLKSKTGSTYGIKGRLANLEYNGHKYVGFERTGFANTDSIPNVWLKHTFTEDEKALLEAGKTVYIEGLVGKKGKPFSANVRYDVKDGDTRKSLILEFNN